MFFPFKSIARKQTNHQQTHNEQTMYRQSTHTENTTYKQRTHTENTTYKQCTQTNTQHTHNVHTTNTQRTHTEHTTYKQSTNTVHTSYKYAWLWTVCMFYVVCFASCAWSFIVLLVVIFQSFPFISFVLSSTLIVRSLAGVRHNHSTETIVLHV